jgi:hypothetical protein
VAAWRFSLNREAVVFIERFCFIVDFEYFQTDMLGLHTGRRDDISKQLLPNAFPLEIRMHNHHSYEQKTVSMLNLRIPGKRLSLASQ